MGRGLVVEARRTGQKLEEKMVHPQRQLSLLLRIHHRQRTSWHYSAGEYSGPRSARQEASLFRAVHDRERSDQGLQDRRRWQGRRRQAHCLPDVRVNRRGQGRMDQMSPTKYQP